MKNKGFSLIESLLFFTLVLMIVHYVCMMFTSLNDLEHTPKNQDSYYEEAYKKKK